MARTLTQRCYAYMPDFDDHQVWKSLGAGEVGPKLWPIAWSNAAIDFGKARRYYGAENIEDNQWRNEDLASMAAERVCAALYALRGEYKLERGVFRSVALAARDHVAEVYRQEV